MPNDKHSSDHEKCILGRRYDFSLKYIYNMTRRHDTRHHGFMYYIHEVISSHVSPCLSARIPLRRFKAQKQFSCCFNHVVSIGVKMKVYFPNKALITFGSSTLPSSSHSVAQSWKNLQPKKYND